jgi:hypothetical protein
MIKVLRSITGAKVSDANYEADRVYPIAGAVANGLVTGLYKVMEALRADLHYRRRRWWPQ